MATRKPETRKPRGTSPDASLTKAGPHEQILALQKERHWLLKQIRRKRTELDNFISQMRDLASEVFQRSSTTLNSMRELDEEIHALFNEILTKRKLGKRSRHQVEQVYRNLQLQGVISVNPDFRPDEDDIFGAAGLGDEDFPDGFDAETFRQAFAEEQEAASSGRSPGEDAAADAQPTHRDRAFRQTFLRLASVYHPDRAEDEDTQARNTEIMKEINRAYKSGDFARLLELEQQKDQDEMADLVDQDSDLERQCKQLERENTELKDQYEGIKRELRELRNNTQEGIMVKTYRKAAKEGVDLVSELVDEAAGEVEAMEEIRDFVRDFRDRKMTIKQFIEGPGPRSPEEMVAAMEEMLGVTINFDPEMFR